MPWSSNRDRSAKLRGLAGELGLELVKMPNADTWQLRDRHGTPLLNPKIQATGFRTRDALEHLLKLRRKQKRD